jgi:hypothetical protein
LETQKTANSQGSTEQKEQCWKYHTTWLQTILQSHSNKNSLVLAKKPDMSMNTLQRTWQQLASELLGCQIYTLVFF